MSDEEKKAIQYLNKYCDTDLLYEQRHYNYIKMIIRLVGKQSKEIEELKEKNKELYEIKYIASRVINRSMKQFSIGEFKYKVNNFIEWEDKIKAKIEECENKIKKIRNKKLINEPEDTIIITRYAHYISVLQSLLEKE